MNLITEEVIERLDERINEMSDEDEAKLLSKRSGIRSKQIVVLIDLLVELRIIRIGV